MAGNETAPAGAALTAAHAAPSPSAALPIAPATASPSTSESDTGSSEAPVTKAAATVARIDGLRCDALTNARYHSVREGFMDTAHRWLLFFVIVAGTGAVVDVIATSAIAKGVLGAVAAALAALDLTFDLSNRARMHALMKRRYFELLADLAERKKTADEVEACIHRYSADEEPAYHALLRDSWNAAQQMVYGDEAQHLPLPWHHRWFMNWLRFNGTYVAGRGKAAT